MYADRTDVFDQTERDLLRELADDIAHARDGLEVRARQQELPLFRTATESTGHAVYFTDTDGTIEYVNPAFEEITGYTADEAIGRTPRILQSGEQETEYYEELWDTILAGDIWRDELVNTTRSGDRYVIDQTIAPVEGESGEIDHFVAVNVDITERRRREQTLEALHEATRRLFEAETTELVAERTAAAAKSVLGYPINVVRLLSDDAAFLEPVAVTEQAEDRMGDRPVYRVGEGPVGETYGTGRSRVIDDVQDLDDDVDRGDVRGGLYLPLGEYGAISINDTEAAAFDPSDVRVAELLAANAAAALENVEREQQLQQQTERLEEFASVVSHDLRNPLNVATGRLELARQECASDQLDEVAQAHDRMDALIDDLLTLAREGESVADIEPVGLAETIEGCWRTVATGPATLITETDRTIWADPARLQQLLENLIRNAVEHGGDAVTVTIGELADGFYVADDGSGIPEDTREQVLESGYSTSEAGTGFGLSIVQEIATAHDWTIRVTESEAGGARIEFTGVDFAQ